MAIDQFDGLDTAKTDATEVTAKINASKIKTDNDAIVILSGDSKGTAAAGAVVNLKDETPSYTKDLQNVTYNGISGTVVRIYGLDATKVVTVDGTTAKYYTKTDNSIVHVACVPATTAPVINVTTGTPEVMLYGNANSDAAVDPIDATQLSRMIAGVTIRGTKYELPTDLMSLHALDVDANGGIDPVDLTNLKRSVAGVTVRGTLFSLNTMGCYKK